MNAPHRPSILSRPRLKDGGRANVENFDSEWAAEEARRAAKTRRAAAVEERMDHACYATHEERRQAWAPAQREAAQLAAARAAALAAADGREAAWLAQPQTVVVDTQRPWNAASSTYYMPREVEEAAHRRGQQAAADVNHHTAQLRAVQKVQQRAAEQDALRRDYEAEDSYFNRGAASERWIPPEHRIKHRAATPQQRTPAPPPFWCDTETGRGASVSTRSSTPTSTICAPAATPAAPTAAAATHRPASSGRRAAEGQAMAALLRNDAPPPPSGRSFTRQHEQAYGAAAAAAAAAPGKPAEAPARPQTAPMQPRQYPWSWA